MRRGYVQNGRGLSPKSARQSLIEVPFSLGVLCSSCFPGASELSRHHVGKGAPTHRPEWLVVMLAYEKWSLWGALPYRAWPADGDSLPAPHQATSTPHPIHTQPAWQWHESGAASSRSWPTLLSVAREETFRERYSVPQDRMQNGRGGELP